MRRTVALLVLAVTALLSGCNGHGAVSQDVSGSNGYQSGDLTLTYVNPGHRHSPGDVTGKLLDGSAFDLAAWKGKVVVLNWWESDCAPCHAEAQALQQVYSDLRTQGVEFLGVNVRDNVPSALSYQRKYGVTYPSLDDPANSVALAFRRLPPQATPTTIVLDRNGRIAARENGEVYFAQLTNLVKRVLAESA